MLKRKGQLKVVETKNETGFHHCCYYCGKECKVAIRVPQKQLWKRRICEQRSIRTQGLSVPQHKFSAFRQFMFYCLNFKSLQLSKKIIVPLVFLWFYFVSSCIFSGSFFCLLPLLIFIHSLSSLLFVTCQRHQKNASPSVMASRDFPFTHTKTIINR